MSREQVPHTRWQDREHKKDFRSPQVPSWGWEGKAKEALAVCSSPGTIPFPQPQVTVAPVPSWDPCWYSPHFLATQQPAAQAMPAFWKSTACPHSLRGL